MHITSIEIIVTFLLLTSIALAIWLCIVVFKRDSYTRERYAFIATSGFASLAASVLSSIASKETPWSSLNNLARALCHLPLNPPEQPRTTDHLLMILVLFITYRFASSFYLAWDGAISTRQWTRDRHLVSSPMVTEGLVEAARIFKRDPPLEKHAPHQDTSALLSLDFARDNLAWHIQARDLIRLHYPSVDIDADLGWHQENHCWVGSNKHTSSSVVVICSLSLASESELLRILQYLQRLPSVTQPIGNTDIFVAVRNGVETNLTLSGITLRVVTEDSLLANLVDFSDYYAAVRHRVERQLLTDSSLTIEQVYTAPSCKDEDGAIHSDLQNLISEWLVENSQRQVALLGEYGQGKSTSALMIAHHLINSPHSSGRIPILLELRGKSPRNMSPEELIAGWAYPYRINPQALLKLIIAGRIFLILEGFDEMALVGDQEARISHFRTLWRFCYPTAKIMITGRPNFFLDDMEMKAALGIQKATGAGPYCAAIYLEPFNLSQIASTLRSFPEKVRSEILTLAKRDRQFLEIVSRGSLLYVVSQLWERENLADYKGLINSAVVMNLFIKHSYRRQSQKIHQSPNFMILNESERSFFMSGIAAYMGAKELPNQIGRDELDQAVRRLYELIPDSASHFPTGMPQKPNRHLKLRLGDAEDPVEDVETDVRSTGILVFDQSKAGAFRFSHKSFMEFLIADVYGEHLAGTNKEISSALMAATQLHSRELLTYPESVRFLGEILIAHLRTQGKTGPTAQLLFDAIAVDGNGGGFLGKVRARLGLRNLQWIGYARFATRKRNLFLRTLMIFPGTSMFRLEFMVLMVGAMLAEVAVGGRIFLHWNISRALVSAGITAGLLSSIAYVMVSSVSVTASIRLWFSCCALLGLKREEVEAVGCRVAYLDPDYLSIGGNVQIENFLE